jgi:hypothetical protein
MQDYCTWFEEDSGYLNPYNIMKDDLNLSVVSLPRGWE